MEELDQLLVDLAGYAPGADHSLVRRAYEFAVQAHDGQPKSGDHRVAHPLAVARIITELRLDVASVGAGMLPHRVEDGSATVEQLGELFGREIAFLADGVTRLRKLPYSTVDESQAETVRKMVFAMARDLRVVLIKLCDRLATMRSLHHLPPEQRQRIAADTMQIDARLTNRLGIEPMKIELEDLAFKYLYPGEYEQLAAEAQHR